MASAVWRPYAKVGVALYGFEPNGAHQVGLVSSDEVRVYQEGGGWYKGMVVRTRQTGIFPANYVNITGDLPADELASELQELRHRSASYQRARNESQGSTKTGVSGVSTASSTTASSASSIRRASEQRKSVRVDRAASDDMPATARAALRRASKKFGDAPISYHTTPNLYGDRGKSVRLDAIKQEPEEVSTPVQSPMSPMKDYGAVAEAGDMSGDPLMNDINESIKEWNNLMKDAHKEKNTEEFNKIKARISSLVEAKKAWIATGLSDAVKEERKQYVIKLMAQSRQILGLDVIPRTPKGQTADEANTGAIQLYHLHQGFKAALEGANDDPAAKVESEAKSKKKGKSWKSVTRDLLRGDKDRSDATMLRMPDSQCQLVVDVKAFIIPIGDPADVYISLYSHSQNQVITEPYVVPLTAQGMPESVTAALQQGAAETPLKVVFKDIGPKEFQGDLYVIVRIVRRGRLVWEEKLGMSSTSTKKGVEPEQFKRPFGCGFLQVSSPQIMDKLMNEDEREFCPDNIKIYRATSTNAEAVFATMHENLIRKTHSFDLDTKSKGVAIGMTLLEGEYTQILNEHEELRNVCVCNKLYFPDIIQSTDLRNDLYVTMVEGDFSSGGKRSGKNVEVTVQLRNFNGQKLGAVYDGSVTGLNRILSEYSTAVYYHTNSPKFEETVRLQVPPEQVEHLHLFFMFRHCSSHAGRSEYFGFAYMPLVDAEKGLLHPNGVHKLDMFKPHDKTLSGPQYLQEAVRNKLLLSRESFIIRSQLVSTKLTQNTFLNSLLKWHNNKNSMNMANILKQFTFIEPVEIVKFLREIFDVLFDIWAQKGEEQDVSLLVYDALVFILGLITDDRFTSFRPILDSYIVEMFTPAKKTATGNAPPNPTHQKLKRAHTQLARCLKYYLQNQDHITFSSNLRSSMKCIKYLFKLLIKSRMLYEETDVAAVTDKENFKDVVSELLGMINTLMSKSSPAWVIGAQITLLKNFSSVFEDLSALFTPKELGDITVHFVNAVNAANLEDTTTSNQSSGATSASAKQKKLRSIEKLNLFSSVVTGHVMSENESRDLCIPLIMEQVKGHLKLSKEEVEACFRVLMDLISTAEKDPERPEYGIIRQILPILYDIVLAVIGIDINDGFRPDAVTTLFAIMKLIAEDQYQNFAKVYLQDGRDKERFFVACLGIMFMALEQPVYPEPWLIMSMFQINVTTRWLSYLGHDLETEFMEESEKYYAMWKHYFTVSAALMNAKTLQLENFSPSKQKMIFSRIGDVRTDVANRFKTMWAALGDKQMNYVRDLVHPIISMTRNGSPDLREMGFTLYFDMLKRENADTGSFMVVENRTIDSVDEIVSGGTLDEQFISSFTSQLETRFKAEGGQLQSEGFRFVKDVSELMEHLTRLERYPKTALFEDERTVACLKLMSYLSHTGKWRLFVKYVKYLRDMHVELNNHVEAGMTSLLLLEVMKSDAMNTRTRGMSVASNSENQSLFDVQVEKEPSFVETINHFDQGKYWERAIELIKELKDEYVGAYEYKKLSDLLHREAKMFSQIIETDRFYAEYFRVGYYGSGFAEYNLQNKEFVYRGVELERLSEFMDRLQRKWPHAAILKTNDPPAENVLNSTGCHIQLAMVYVATEAEYNTGKEPPENDTIPSRIQKFHKHNSCRVFRYTRSYRKGTKKDKNNEFKDLWTCHTYLLTKDNFPTTHRRSEVIDRRDFEFSPVETAVQSILQKNKELQTNIAKYADFSKEDPDMPNISPLSMMLNGVIDAAVNGGTDMYKEAFLTEEFMASNPDMQTHCNALKIGLAEQVDLLERGLEIHENLVDEGLRGLHLKMQVFFEDKIKPSRPEVV